MKRLLVVMVAAVLWGILVLAYGCGTSGNHNNDTDDSDVISAMIETEMTDSPVQNEEKPPVETTTQNTVPAFPSETETSVAETGQSAAVPTEENLFIYNQNVTAPDDITGTEAAHFLAAWYVNNWKKELSGYSSIQFYSGFTLPYLSPDVQSCSATLFRLTYPESDTRYLWVLTVFDYDHDLKTYLSAAWPAEDTKAPKAEKLLPLLRADTRFGGNFSIPAASFSKGITQCSVSAIIPEYDRTDIYKYDGRYLLTLCYNVVPQYTDNMIYNSICDLTVKFIDTQNFSATPFSYTIEGSYNGISVQNCTVPRIEISLISESGKKNYVFSMTVPNPEKPVPQEHDALLEEGRAASSDSPASITSPDGAFTALSSGASVLVNDNAINRKKNVFVEIPYSAEKGIEACRGAKLFCWIDNTRLLYNIYGWEWKIGIGIYDTASSENKIYENGISVFQLLGDTAYYTTGTYNDEKFTLGYFCLNEPNTLNTLFEFSMEEYFTVSERYIIKSKGYGSECEITVYDRVSLSPLYHYQLNNLNCSFGAGVLVMDNTLIVKTYEHAGMDTYLYSISIG